MAIVLNYLSRLISGIGTSIKAAINGLARIVTKVTVSNETRTDMMIKNASKGDVNVK